jgi:hypothetical protein
MRTIHNSDSQFRKSTELNVIQISNLTVQGVHRGEELNLEQAAYTFPELGLCPKAASDQAKQSPTSLNHLIGCEGQKHQQ